MPKNLNYCPLYYSKTVPSHLHSHAVSRFSCATNFFSSVREEGKSEAATKMAYLMASVLRKNTKI